MLIAVPSAQRVNKVHRPPGPPALKQRARNSISFGTHSFYLFKIVFIWLLWVLVVACGIWFPDQGLKPGPHIGSRVLATEPPGKFLYHCFQLITSEFTKRYFNHLGREVTASTGHITQMEMDRDPSLPSPIYPQPLPSSQLLKTGIIMGPSPNTEP